MSLSNETKELLTTIAENLPKVYEAGLSAPREVIYLTNGIRIESRENGVWIVDGEEAVQLYDSRWQTLQADYADCSREADYAYYDPSGRELKGTTVEDNGDEGYVNVTLYDGSIISYGVVEDISIEIPEDEINLGYTSCLHFSVGENAWISSPSCVYYVGNGTEDGTIVIDGWQRYTIKYEYNGNMVIGYVKSNPSYSYE